MLNSIELEIHLEVNRKSEKNEKNGKKFNKYYVKDKIRCGCFIILSDMEMNHCRNK